MKAQFKIVVLQLFCRNIAKKEIVSKTKQKIKVWLWKFFPSLNDFITFIRLVMLPFRHYLIIKGESEPM